MNEFRLEKPIIFNETNRTLADLSEFRKGIKIWKEIDIYELQLNELFEINHPSLIFSQGYKTHRDEFVRKELIRRENELVGSWIYYPWSGVLLHTVSEEDYVKLRTNRNRNLITEDEQQTLSAACIGIVGLSVGSHVAAALVYGGIANHMKLAEFDSLETTNLNRARGYLGQVGTSKLNLLSQQIFEINPFMNLYGFPEKIDKNNLENFVTGNPKPQVIFEIIDSFEMKIYLRALAREQGIPVIMVTNLGDRVLMDVERYDLDKTVEYFNGRAGKVPSDILEKPDITAEDKHKYAVALAGVEHIPKRALDSVDEIGKTLVGRPQLASTVAVAGGISSYLARKIILKQSLPSGSWLVDLDKIFNIDNSL